MSYSRRKLMKALMAEHSRRDFMTVYHVNVERRTGWFIGRVLERPGVTTEGRTLEELVAMLRDAIEAVWGEKQVQLELLVSSEVAVGASRRKPRKASA